MAFGRCGTPKRFRVWAMGALGVNRFGIEGWGGSGLDTSLTYLLFHTIYR